MGLRMHLKHDIRQTSLLSFYEELPHLGKRQLEVLKAIRDLNSIGQYPTDWEITKVLQYADPNKVRPRRNELMRYGLIEEAGRRQCSITGKLALTWKLSPRILDKIDLILKMQEEVRE